MKLEEREDSWRRKSSLSPRRKLPPRFTRTSPTGPQVATPGGTRTERTPILCKTKGSRSQKVITSKPMLEEFFDFLTVFFCLFVYLLYCLFYIWQMATVAVSYGKILLSMRSIHKPDWKISYMCSLLEVFKLLVCDESR